MSNGNVVISPNVKKETVKININGDVLDANKNIIQKNEPEYIPPVQQQVVEPVYKATQAPISNVMSVQEQIDEAKKKLAELEELKKLKIAQMKAELELLEQ